jgi:hypothetical protein
VNAIAAPHLLPPTIIEEADGAQDREARGQRDKPDVPEVIPH